LTANSFGGLACTGAASRRDFIMRAPHLIVITATAATLWGCSGLKDCKEDGAACAEMLNANAEACAQAFQLKTSDRKRKYCENAIDVVRKAKVKEAVPGLVTILGQPETKVYDDKHRRVAAKALGQIGDVSAVEGLINAMDLSVGTSSDPKDKAANKSNEAIAKALGKLKAAKAVPKLLQIIDKSRDNYVILEAVRSLGKIGDGGAVAKLAEIATTHENKFMRKNAIVALGDIGDPKGTDALVEMMFVEYQGVSFYREASFALYQVGPAVADALLNTMALKNEKVNAFFEKIGGMKESAIKAKCGFVLGDLRDKRAVEPLLEAFKAASDPKSLDPVVMTYASTPLAVLGDARAVPLLKGQMMTLDASLRDPMMRGLNMLGDRAVVPDMIAAMGKDNFVAECVKQTGSSAEVCGGDETKASLQGAQKAAADHASNLAGPEHVDAYKAQVDAEKDAKIKEYFSKNFARVKAAAECKADAKCWAKKLSDGDWRVREKAAWELMRLKDTSVLDDLAKNLKDKKAEARSAAIMAYWAYGDGRVIDAVRQQLEDEESSADYIRVNEDLKRLLVHLERNKK